MSEIINCPGCGAEISDDSGSCLLCGKEIRAGGVPQKRSDSGDPSNIGNYKDPNFEKVSAPRDNDFKSVSFINGEARQASSRASIIMIISAIIGVIVAVALSIVAGFSAMVPFVGIHWGVSHAEEIIFLFAFAFLAANAVTGGNFGYRAGRHIAVSFGMDAGGGPGVSSFFLWGGYAGGFLCAILFALFMRHPLTFGISGTGVNFLFTFFIACVISVIAGNYLAIAKNKKYYGSQGSSCKQ